MALVWLLVLTDFGRGLKTNAGAMIWGLSDDDLRKSVVIMGEKFTCGEIVGDEDGECDWQTRITFVRWGDNLNAYIKSESLGPLGDDIRSLDNPTGLVSFREVAAIGLYACRHMATNASQDEFVDWLHELHPDQDRSVLLPFWSGAQQFLCADTAGENGYRSAYMWLD